jgi:hypothetical protein
MPGDERVSGQGECPGCGHDGGVGVYACPSCRANAIEDALGEHYTGGGADALPDDVRALGVRHAWADGRRLRAEKDALALRAREERMRAVVEAADVMHWNARSSRAYERSDDLAESMDGYREARAALDREDPPACAPDGEPMPTRSRRMIDAQRALAALTPDEERGLLDRGGWRDGVEDPSSTDPDPREMREPAPTAARHVGRVLVRVPERAREAPRRATVKIPKRFGPEWWACYAAAFAVERAAVERAEPRARYSYDRTRAIRSSIAECCATIADDAIQGFAEAVEGGCVSEDWSKLHPVDGDGAERGARACEHCDGIINASEFTAPEERGHRPGCPLAESA